MTSNLCEGSPFLLLNYGPGQDFQEGSKYSVTPAISRFPLVLFLQSLETMNGRRASGAIASVNRSAGVTEYFDPLKM